MEKKMFAFTSLLAAFFCMVIFSSFSKLESPTGQPADTLNADAGQRISSYSLDKSFSFAGEAIPVEHFDVRERLDRELIINTYLHAAQLLHIKTAERYFPVIEPIMAKYGIPDDIKYLCVAESGLRMATSSAGAKGLWQFMEASGEAYGLEVNTEVDERFHVEKSTEAACKFLLHLHKRFGSWTLAAAAYNMGEGGLNKRITEQRAKTFYDLNLNDETSRYLFRILAIKEIMQHPEQFGYYVEQKDKYPPLDDYITVTVNTSVPNLADLAVEHGTTYRMLKVLNPWLISTALTNKSRKQYEIRLPRQG